MINVLKKRFFEDFGAEPLLPDNIIFDGKGLFEVSAELKRAVFRVKPLSSGLLLSYNNRPCQSLLDLNKKRIKNYIVLNEKSSFLFTCNRKLLKKGIIEKKGRGNVFAALNEKGEVIGIIKYSSKTYNNIVNIGYFLEQDKIKKIIF